MYDYIKIKANYPFTSDDELNEFCRRHLVTVRDDIKGIVNNSERDGLEQNKGIYIKIEIPNIEKGRKGEIVLKFSLHKFYNDLKGLGRQNFNRFTFEDANEAYIMFLEFLQIDLTLAKVQYYEVGINIITKIEPDKYLAELNHIVIKKERKRIIEDVNEKEYKQYSTNKSEKIRVVHVFYNKTFEAKSKLSKSNKIVIPVNVLRVEKRHRRVEKIGRASCRERV